MTDDDSGQDTDITDEVRERSNGDEAVGANTDGSSGPVLTLDGGADSAGDSDETAEDGRGDDAE